MNSASRHRQGIQPKKENKAKAKERERVLDLIIITYFQLLAASIAARYTVLREDQQQRVYDVLIIICHK
jgi:hypothetical protein